MWWESEIVGLKKGEALGKIYNKFFTCFDIAFNQSILQTSGMTTYSRASSYKFNAKVFFDTQNKVSISIENGVKVAITDCVLELISDLSFWEDFKGFEGEVEKMPNGSENNQNRYINYNDFFDRISKNPIKSPISNFIFNKKRIELGLCISSFCARFIANHELSHYLFGHLGYLYSTFGLFNYGEIDSSKKNTLKPIDFQFMEIQADLNAAIIIIASANSSVKWVSPDYDFINTIEDLIAIVFLSFIIVFCILELADKSSNKDKSERHHPTAKSRIHSCIIALHQELYRNTKYKGIDINKCLKRINIEMPKILRLFNINLFEQNYFNFLLHPQKRVDADGIARFYYEDKEMFEHFVDTDESLKDYLLLRQRSTELLPLLSDHRKTAMKIIKN